MSDIETQTTLRDTIENAIDDISTPEDNNEPRVVDRARDDVGRFAPKEKEPEPQSKEVVQQDVVQPLQTQQTPGVQRPTSWKKDYDEHWGKLDPSIQTYIAQREADYAKGVSMYKQQFEQVAPLHTAIQPLLPVLQEYGMTADKWIRDAGNFHTQLIRGTPEQKLAMFTKLATDYGINLQGLTGQPVDHQFSAVAQELSQLKGQWQNFQNLQEEQQQTAIQSEIQAFAEKNPHFEEVRMSMGQLLQSGMAQNLDEAYKKAIRLNDDVWQQQQARQAEADAAERQKVIAEKKAKAVSPRSSSPTGIMSSGNGKKSTRDILSEKFDELVGSRL